MGLIILTRFAMTDQQVPKKRESQVMHICHCRVFVRLEGIYRFIDFKQHNTGGKRTSGHNDLDQVRCKREASSISPIFICFYHLVYSIYIFM